MKSPKTIIGKRRGGEPQHERNTSSNVRCARLRLLAFQPAAIGTHALLPFRRGFGDGFRQRLGPPVLLYRKMVGAAPPLLVENLRALHEVKSDQFFHFLPDITFGLTAQLCEPPRGHRLEGDVDRKSTRLNSSHLGIS